MESEPHPPIEIIELSLASSGGLDEAIGQLRSFAEGISSRELLRETIVNMQAALERDPSRARAIAEDLYGMALQRTFPPNADLPELYGVAYAFDPEEADWAPSGDEAVEYLRDVLAKLGTALSAAL